jgi:hypothetical protein
MRRSRFPRSLALACAAALCASCAATPESPPTIGPAVVLDAPSLDGVDPAFLPEFRRVQALLADGGFLAARSALDGILARRPTGRTLEVARRFEAVLDLDPSSLPALRALQASVEGGADAEATAILDRLMLRRPRGRLLTILEAYRRILDGRAVVGGLRLRLELRPEAEAPPPASKGAPKEARFSRLFLVVESALAERATLEPGPATLFVTRSTVDGRGVEDDGVETHSFPDLKPLAVEPGKSAEVSLARFFVAPPEKGLACRLRFGIDLRSGKAKVEPGGGAKARELPAMRLRAAEAEASALEPSLAAQPAAKPEELAALVEGASRLDAIEALSLAVRLAPGERGAALDLLTPLCERAPESVLESLAPALRWIAVTAEPGGDGLAWRAWLRGRTEKRPAERQRLVLPPPEKFRPDSPE